MKDSKNFKTFEKLKKIFTEHPIRTIISIFCVLIIVPTVLVHALYTIPAPFWWLEYKIPAGNMLAYIGTVLTFCATFSLSAMVYISNKDKDKKECLLKNRAFISIDKNQEIEITIIDLRNRNNADIFLKINIDLLSEAVLSAIRMKCISIDGRGIKRNGKCYFKDFSENPQIVNCPRMDKKHIKPSFNLTNVEKGIAKFIRETDSISIAFDVDFICENVKTPYTINLGLKAKGKKEGDDLTYIYSLEELYFHYQDPKFR